MGFYDGDRILWLSRLGKNIDTHLLPLSAQCMLGWVCVHTLVVSVLIGYIT